jgi:hypothetical protein
MAMPNEASPGGTAYLANLPGRHDITRVWLPGIYGEKNMREDVMWVSRVIL